MGIGRVKLRKTDRIFTRIVRKLYNYTCQKCGKVYDPNGNLHNLGVSHYFSRAKESVRFDLDNVTLLCNLQCHHDWETEKRGEYKDYMIKRLGQDGFDRLEVRAYTPKHRDDKMDEIVLKQMEKEIVQGEG